MCARLLGGRWLLYYEIIFSHVGHVDLLLVLAKKGDRILGSG